MAAMNTIHEDPKSLLMRFLQRRSGRAMTKQDIHFATEKYDQGYQATLCLPVLGDGMEFVGELGSSAKEAERYAAMQAVDTYAGEIEELEANFVPSSKRKKAERDRERADGVEPVISVGKGAAKEATVSQHPGRLMSRSTAPASGDCKSSLNHFLQRFLQRPITKEDWSYDNVKYDEGMQCTLTLNCMDGAVFVGEVADSTKVAQNSAAQMAVNAYADEIANMPPPAKKSRGKDGKDGKGEKGKPSFTNAFGEPSPSPTFGKSFEKGYQGFDKGYQGFAKGYPSFAKGGGGAKGPMKGGGFKGMAEYPYPMAQKGNSFFSKGMPFKGQTLPQRPMMGEWPMAAPGKGHNRSFDHSMPRLSPTARLSPMAARLPKRNLVGPSKGLPSQSSVFGGRVRPDSETSLAPKCQLNTFLQRFLRRPVTKEDQDCSVEKVDEEGYQATLTLHCLNGEVFLSDISATEKEAENSAALKCLEEHAQDVEAHPPEKKKRKRKEEGEPRADPAANGANSDKCELNSVCMKILKRTLAKAEITYETNRGEDGTYQAVVSLDALQDSTGNSVWSGEVCSTKQLAEHSAARLAVEAIKATPEHAQTLEDRANEPPRKKGKGKGKDKDS